MLTQSAIDPTALHVCRGESSFFFIWSFHLVLARTIFWLAEPLGLGSSLAGLATFGFCAVSLSVSTIRAENEELSAMEALTR
jgi:hypothetical protein